MTTKATRKTAPRKKTAARSNVPRKQTSWLKSGVRLSQGQLLLVVAAVIGIGAFVIWLVRAGSLIATEPETWTASGGNVKVVADASVSGGGYIEFGAPTVTSSVTPSTPPPSPPTGVKPSAANTGWQPTGVTLASSGEITVTQDGSVIDAKNITGCVNVNANNVTIKRSKITVNCSRGIVLADGKKGLIIEDVEINGQRLAADCIAFSNYTARRVNLYGCEDGAKIGDNTTIENSYIHDLTNANGCHCDGVQSTGGTNTVLKGNTINDPRAGSAIMLGNEFGNLVNITIDGNWINSDNYGIYGGWNQSTGYQPTNEQIINNKFGRSFGYGPAAYVAPSTVWSNNTYEDNGAVIPK